MGGRQAVGAALAASQAASSAGPWIWAVVAAVRGPQRRLRGRRVTLEASAWRPSWRPAGSQSCAARVWRSSSFGMPAITIEEVENPDLL